MVGLTPTPPLRRKRLTAATPLHMSMTNADHGSIGFKMSHVIIDTNYPITSASTVNNSGRSSIMNGQAPVTSDQGTTHTLSSSPTIERSDIPSKGERVRQDVKASEPAQQSFFARTDAMSQARKIYFKVFIRGFLVIVLVVFAVFSIYWGSVWKIPAHPVNGWIVVCLRR